MPKKQIDETPSLNLTQAIDQLAETKGLTRDAVILALKEAVQRAYIRYLGGGDDARVEVEINEETGKLTVAQIKKVVEEVEDDYLEISVEDANEGKKKAKYKAGDDYAITCSSDDLTKVTALAIKNNLRQRLAEAERASLYENYKDHIGEMMMGIVEKADDRSVTVKLGGRSIVELSRRDLIGDEFFRPNDPIKVYIQEVRSAEPIDGKPARGPQIEATRSSEGFLKRLFEEEIHEIYDGTVVIKAIARQAGVRSKVAVYSQNEDVDATGACIGQGGSRIQQIVSQLGNAQKKEKIDIINYSENPACFIIEAVRPVQALGVAFLPVEEGKLPEAIVVINDGDTPLAMGKFRSNLTLAQKLTGYRIDFLEKKVVDDRGIAYTTSEEWIRRAEEEAKLAEREAYIKKSREEAAKRIVETKKEEEKKPVEAPKAAVTPEQFPSEAAHPAAAALAAVEAEKSKEKEKEETVVAPVEEKKEETAPVTENIAVKTTKSLSELEAELASGKEKRTKSQAKSKRPRKITEEEVKHDAVKPAVNVMPVYTDEELQQIAAEEAANANEFDYSDDYELEEDYSEYDDYDDDGGRA